MHCTVKLKVIIAKKGHLVFSCFIYYKRKLPTAINWKICVVVTTKIVLGTVCEIQVESKQIFTAVFLSIYIYIPIESIKSQTNETDILIIFIFQENDVDHNTWWQPPIWPCKIHCFLITLHKISFDYLTSSTVLRSIWFHLSKNTQWKSALSTCTSVKRNY